MRLRINFDSGIQDVPRPDPSARQPSGIDVTANDPLDNDTGPNNEQNHPILSSLTPSGSSGTIEGRLEGERTVNYVIDVYLNRMPDAAAGGRACDPSDLGEGEIFLHSFTLRTDAIGTAQFTIDVTGIAQENGDYNGDEDRGRQRRLPARRVNQ